MKKIFTLSALALAAMSMNAEMNIISMEKAVVTENLPVAVTTEGFVGAAPQEATATIADGAYIAVFGTFTNYETNDGKNMANLASKVKFMPNDSVLLEGFAQGYDIYGKIDAAKQKITINLPQVLGKTSAGATITCYKLQVSTGKYFNNAQTYVMTATENGLVGENDFGLYAATGSGGYAMMKNIECTKANGKTNITFNTQTGTIPVENPVSAVYDREGKKLTVTALNASFYGSYIPTVLTVDSEAKAMATKAGEVFDRYEDSKGKFAYILCPIEGQYLNPQGANKLTYTTTEKSTVITFANASGKQFVGYNSSGSQWSGFSPYPWTITLDFNIDADTTGVENIAVEENAPVEYFNLQGMKVNSNNLKAGIYVVRQGNKATKVLVK